MKSDFTYTVACDILSQTRRHYLTSHFYWLTSGFMQDILLQIHDGIQSDIALQKQVH